MALVSEDTDKLLSQIANEEHLFKYNTIHKCNSSKGQGYFGIITRSEIIGKTKSGKNRSLHLVIKSASKCDALRSQAFIWHQYDREVYLYETIFPAFRKFLLSKQRSLYIAVPKLYKTSMKNKSESVVMEDLYKLGYKLHDKRIPMNDGHVNLVLENYGRFHALSFALRNQSSKKFDEITAAIDGRHVTACLADTMIDNFLRVLNKAKEAVNEDVIVLETFDRFMSEYDSFIRGIDSKVDQYGAILHGDCWANNMMFRYEDKENPSRPTKVRLLDFQLSRMGSPVLDLAYFLYTCAPAKKFNNLEECLKIYYDSFSTYLRQLGSDPDELFPFSVLQEDWKRYARYGLILAAFLIYLSLTEEQEAISLAEATENQQIGNAFSYEIARFDEYKRRMRALILHFVDNKLI